MLAKRKMKLMELSEAVGITMSNLNAYYQSEVIPKMRAHFKYKNLMEVPKLDKIVLNMGLGEAIQNIKVLDAAVEEWKIWDKMDLGSSVSLKFPNWSLH